MGGRDGLPGPGVGPVVYAYLYIGVPTVPRQASVIQWFFLRGFSSTVPLPPNPTIVGPHIFGSTPVLRRMISSRERSAETRCHPHRRRLPIQHLRLGRSAVAAEPEAREWADGEPSHPSRYRAPLTPQSVDRSVPRCSSSRCGSLKSGTTAVAPTRLSSSARRPVPTPMKEYPRLRDARPSQTPSPI